jgi:hypothetical protein
MTGCTDAARRAAIEARRRHAHGNRDKTPTKQANQPDTLKTQQQAQDTEVLAALAQTSRSRPISRNELGTQLSRPGGGMGPNLRSSGDLSATVHRLMESGKVKYDSNLGGLYVAGNRPKRSK